MNKLEICLDLGSDTLKVAYAYENNGETYFGKLPILDMENELSSGIPAIAFYDEKNEKWLYADQVDKVLDSSFTHVVKIKELLSLLLKVKDEIFKINSNYYFNMNQFPKFNFPAKTSSKDDADFSHKVNANDTFEAEGFTPQKVCENFFTYVKNKLYNETIKNMGVELGISFEITPSFVYPSKAGKSYVNELQRIIEKVFGKKCAGVLSSTKAIGLYSYHQKLIKKGQSILIFDMGEEDISVSKIKISKQTGRNAGIVIDGQDGHMPPLNIGGNDFDEAIANYLEDSIEKREIIGTPSYEEKQKRMSEESLYSKQYLLLKEIKNAKIMFSLSDYEILAEQGITIDIHKEVPVQRSFNQNDFLSCTGILDGSKNVAKIVEYVISELLLNSSLEVKDIFFTGGLSETKGLVDIIEEKVKNDYRLKGRKLNFDSFVINDTKKTFYPILEHEDAIYSASVGGALSALKHYKIDLCLSLSYGEKLFFNDIVEHEYPYNEGHLVIFANQDSIVPLNREFVGNSVIISRPYPVNSCDIRIYSIAISKEQIEQMKYNDKVDYVLSNDGRNPCLSLKNNEVANSFAKAQKYLNLKNVAGDGRVNFYYKGNPIYVPADNDYRTKNNFLYQVGIKIDEEGIAHPFIKNVSVEGYRFSEVYCQNKKQLFYNVNATDIEFRLEGLSTFVAEGSVD